MARQIYIKSWGLILGFAFAGFAISVLILLVKPTEYVAKGFLQLGTYGAPDPVRAVDIQPIHVTLHRLNIPSFYDKSLLAACGDQSVDDLYKSVKYSSEKGERVIQIAVRHRDKNVAQSCLLAIVDRITKDESEIAAPWINANRVKLDNVNSELMKLETFQSKLEADMKKFSSNQWPRNLLTYVSFSKNNEIQYLKTVKQNYTNLSSPPLTQSAELLEPVYTSPAPILASSIVQIILGIIGGGIAGWIAAFFKFRSIIQIESN